MDKILIIEDDKIKIEKLSDFFKNEEFLVKESYHSGLSEIVNNNSDYKLLILDMTIPLWDRGNTDLGGNYEQFGGVNILHEMRRRKKVIPTVLVTMFDVFSDGNLTFEELNINLLNRFESFYKGAVFYNASAEDEWRFQLEKLISNSQKLLNND